MRSLREADPVLIWPVHSATAKIGDRRVFGFTAAMAGNAAVAIAMGQLNRLNRFGQRSDLVDLDQDAVGDAFVDAALQSCRVGDEQVVADQLNLVATFVGQHFPAVPVVFAAAVFDRADRILVSPVGQEVDHRAGIEFFAVDLVDAFGFVVEFGRGDIQGDLNLFARLVAGFFDRFHDQIERFDVAAQVGSETAFVADGRVQSFVLKHFLQVVEDLAAATQARR